MKGIKTLIKLKQNELDKLRQSLAEQQEKQAMLVFAEKRLGEELEQEIALAAQQIEMAGFFGNFADGIKKRQQTIREAIVEVQKIIDRIGDKITDAFGELKRFEITLENHQRAQKQKREKHETAQLDEVSILRHGRKQDESNAT
jgi:flagellar protein FliJ